MAGITTHVLDADRGRPAPGVRIDFSVREGDAWRLVKSVVTNADGRTDKPILPGDEARAGQYQLEFHIDAYLKAKPGVTEADIFVDNPVVRFSVFDVKQHYHVPMLCTPGNCATYRGS
ncbi:5-hydroxyisourate hydrolase [Methylobacterium sp. Leaf102]|jgi:5-hydroxyisourate hydrolase|uniref:hydroxyisourate hydrolase n=1 Tax=unclassified Methylobacterium TaxID=2615210 RepID=UPI0006F81DBC|nr:MULTISPECIES: hydroxyisourate hydrolase [unclassified Methylobacterium]USU33395.1 hydroxyisourate hydrolase [Methylobacterium sp. OTU13CASTA1]KQO69655.1 5-hydroxyisourate hydrolase [Methylobacterium sp. Leaf87]KQP34271.1 5-hydroxyisourate hydrolase [Methylobacterium sp. Leaf102]KQP36661.1 5-hydroxyisourate hydrolase [Methylobacterium sp. Leaf100]KQP72332.1 5-hydroxyisourate hydrolase [Methylobacterium sp. Leaf112]